MEQKYRRDIDGLRGIAVLAVWLFHFSPQLLPGGFVGVDVFFVISGYLITGIILRELQADRFSFYDFYAKRIRRIFPSLLVVLLFLLCLGWYVLLPDEYTNLGKHLAAASIYTSNILLNRETGYFDIFAEQKPLLHLWSLGIEEQFYIFWPLLLFVSWKKRSYVLPLILSVGLLSLGLSWIETARNPSAAFYLLPARQWELVIGALLAYNEAARSPFRKNKFYSIAGLLFLLLSFFLLKQDTHFPGIWPLLPCLGSLALILNGPNHWINRKILGSKILVAVGLISYSLYLWHWPLFSLLHILYPDGAAPWLRCAVGASSFFCAWATWKWVETPLRHTPIRDFYRIGSIAVALLLLWPIGKVIYHGKIPSRWNSPAVHELSLASNDWSYPTHNMVQDVLKPESLQGKSKDSVLFIGDSHMEQYWPRLKELQTQNKLFYTAIFATQNTCPAIPDTGAIGYGNSSCDRFFIQASALSQASEVKKVVLSCFWEIYIDEKNLAARMEALKAFITSVKKQNKEVVIVLSTPVSPLFNPHALVGSRFGSTLLETAPVEKKELSPVPPFLRQRLEELATETHSKVIDPFHYLCDEQYCQRYDKNGPLYKDNDHLRAAYVSRAATFIDETIESPPR